MQKYRCHKEVEAGKIAEIFRPDPSNFVELTFEDGSTTTASKATSWKVGGYYVRYEDGYESWSPAEAFESGYTPVNYP